MRVASLIAEHANPRLEEVQRFQSRAQGGGEDMLDDFLSDQDEWDILDDSTLKKVVRDVDGLQHFEIGDRVSMVSGQYKGLSGEVKSINDNSLGKTAIISF